ncbi:MAG: hypothetical protein JRJ79_18325, partial [Deltaproteobacteria bacterium]|nr:hypothetical protein [Deltaproteobacteria bacterium]
MAYLLDERVAIAEDLDLAARASYGFRLSCPGPLEINDLNGLDIVLKAGGKTRQAICNDREPSPSLVTKKMNPNLPEQPDEKEPFSLHSLWQLSRPYRNISVPSQA